MNGFRYGRNVKSGVLQDVHRKTAELRIKAAGPDDGLQEGEFEAYASVFGNVDSYGDIVDKGAFTRTLSEWSDSGDVLPILWGHDTMDPFNNIGGALSAAEDDHGLKIHGQLDLENPTAAQVYRLMKGRRTSKMSFAYAVRDEQKADDGLHLKDLDLFEVSVVQIPANPEATVLTVKAAAEAMLKTGRVLSAKNETALREARDAIDSVLKALDSNDSQDGKQGTTPQEASGTTPAGKDASSEDPEGDKESATNPEPKSAPSVEAMGTLFDTYALAYGPEGV